MALYLAQLTLDKRSEHPSLKDRGVEKRTLAPLSSLNIYGRVVEREIAYAGYVMNISTFVSATSLGKKLAVKAEATGHNPDSSRMIWSSPIPTVVAACKTNLSEARQQTLRESFPDAMIDFQKSGQFTKMFIRNPTDHVITSLLPLFAKFNRSDNLELAASSWKTFRLLTLLINDFLATNSYPAFKDIDETTAEVAGSLEYLDILSIPKPLHYPTRRTDQKLFSAMEVPKGTDDEDEDMDEEVTFETVTGSYLREAVFVAKPSPLPASNNIGPPSEVPELPGIFFPYFHRLIVPDFVTIPRLVGTHFFGYLGSSVHDASVAYDSLVRDWNEIATTEGGMVMSHVLFGIKLALETQSRLFVIQSAQEYHGFCLLGAKFVVYDGDFHVQPVSSEELRDAIAAHSSKHLVALRDLSLAFSAVETKGGRLETYTVDDLTSALKVMKLVDERQWNEEQLERIRASVGKLNFRRTHWQINPTNIQSALSLLTTDSAMPLDGDKYPAHAGQDVNLYGSRTYQVLSFFGPTSFSLINGSGKKITIPKMDEPDVYTTPQADGVEADLGAMHVGMKKLSEAVKDFDTMKTEGWIRQDMKERAGKYRHYVYVGKARDVIWQDLRVKVAPYVVEVPRSKPSGIVGTKKRVVETEAEVDDFFSTLTKRSRV